MSIAAALNPAALVRSRFKAWLQGRLPRHDTMLLTQGNIYILPSKAGFMFGFTVLVLLIASVNYQLNLGYVLTFLLAGSGLVSMHMTHATLRGLTLHLKPLAPTFAGEPAVLEVVVTSPGSARYGIGLKISGASDATVAWIDVPEGGQSAAQVTFIAPGRGRHEVPPVSAETRFPLGLFRVWTVWHPAAQLLAYPRPEAGAPRPPAPSQVWGGSAQSRRMEGDEIEGVRAYRRGDPPKRIAWKKAAKTMESGGELVSRDSSASVHQELRLDWASCGPLAPEERLSRLAAWTLAAHRSGASYSLRLPGVDVPRADGDLQRRRCLEALALWT